MEKKSSSPRGQLNNSCRNSWGPEFREIQFTRVIKMKRARKISRALIGLSLFETFSYGSLSLFRTPRKNSRGRSVEWALEQALKSLFFFLFSPAYVCCVTLKRRKVVARKNSLGAQRIPMNLKTIRSHALWRQSDTVVRLICRRKNTGF